MPSGPLKINISILRETTGIRKKLLYECELNMLKSALVF